MKEYFFDASVNPSIRLMKKFFMWVISKAPEDFALMHPLAFRIVFIIAFLAGVGIIAAVELQWWGFLLYGIPMIIIVFASNMKMLSYTCYTMIESLEGFK